MKIGRFDEARALKWLKYYRTILSDDTEIVESSAKSFAEETGYINERMEHIIEFMWDSQKESQNR